MDFGISVWSGFYWGIEVVFRDGEFIVVCCY